MLKVKMEQQISQIREVFKRHDKNNDGFLEREQVRHAMDEVYDAYLTIGYIFCDEDVEVLIEQCDPTNDDRIDIEEFLNCL